MSGRQAKLDRREIRRAAEAGLRVMQEQQEAAIKAAIQRCNELTTMHDLLSAKVHNLWQRIETLEAKPYVAARDAFNALECPQTNRMFGPDGDARALETPDAG